MSAGFAIEKERNITLTTEEGIVIKADRATAWVKTTKTAACESCAAREGCHTMGGGKEMEVEAINIAGAKAGDRVVIGFETASLMKASFLVYVFPILCMIAGAAAGQEIAPSWGLNISLLSAVMGFGAFFLAFLIIRFMGDKMSEKDKYRAKVIKVRKLARREDETVGSEQ